MDRLAAERIADHRQVARPAVAPRGDKGNRESVDDAETADPDNAARLHVTDRVGQNADDLIDDVAPWPY
jgi:hypothetical protein